MMGSGTSSMRHIFLCLMRLLLFTKAQVLNNTTFCCQQILARYPNQLFRYDDHLVPRWSKTADVIPGCSFFPTDAVEVSDALSVLVSSACPFSLKSGGHSPSPGMNTIEGGIAIDLSWINETTLADDRSHVILGAGGTWGNAYEKLEPHGVLFPGGRAADVGIGGLTLGGGYSWATPRVGFVADNVINFQIVLANASIIDANATRHEDLFMALKGGGNNFGVITRIWLSTCESHALWGGVAAVDITLGVASSLANTERALDEVHRFTTENYEDTNAAVAVQFNFNGTDGRRTIGSFLVHTGQGHESPLHRELMHLRPQIRNTLKQKTMAELSEELSAAWPLGQRYLTTSVGIINDRHLLTKVHKTLDSFCRSASNAIFPATFQCTFIYEPLPHFYTTQGELKGRNILGLNNTHDDYIIVLLQPRWHDGGVDGIMYDYAEAWVKNLRSTYPEKVMPLEYLPYAAPWQAPLGSYGESNLEFMRKVSENYDPDRVFQRLVPGGFKLDKAGGAA